MVTRTIPHFITLHNVGPYGNAYDEPIRINAAEIAYYFDFEDSSGKHTTVRLTSDRKLFTDETAEEIDKLLMMQKGMEIR